MVILKKGDCEHCHKNYHYSLWYCPFGDNSYAYCDSCGALATLNYTTGIVATFPEPETRYAEIDKSWEPLLAACECGGRFRKGGAPRCPYCHEQLSAGYATDHMERQAKAQRGWRWQGDWSGPYCIAIEDPRQPGTLRQVADPVIVPGETSEGKPTSRWSTLFSTSK